MPKFIENMSNFDNYRVTLYKGDLEGYVVTTHFQRKYGNKVELKYKADDIERKNPKTKSWMLDGEMVG